MRELALFAGAGGGILGGSLLGWRTVCAVEFAEYPRRVLLARQRDGVLPRFPIWDDVRTFDGHDWRGKVDVISGGFPCQDISSAGSGAGITGARSGLWKEFARIISEIRPQEVFIENSNHLRTKGLVVVLQDLASMGYDASWGVLGATAVGAPHLRKRMWIVAHNNNNRQRTLPFNAEAPGSPQVGEADWLANWWPLDVLPRVDDGLAHRMDRIRATGNGQVPGVAALAYTTLKWRLQTC